MFFLKVYSPSVPPYVGFSPASGGCRKGSIEYLLDPIELFARGYAQYIPTKTADKKLLDQVENIIKNGLSEEVKLSQWEPENFEPIQKSFDAIFEEMEWLEEI